MTAEPTDRRGQVVLLAALALAVALVALVFAYLQLGFHADTERESVTEPETQAERIFDRAVYNATQGLAQSYDWEDNSAAVQTVHDRLDPTIETLETARLPDGIVYDISYNSTRAADWQQTNCQRGPDRQFGDCETDRGVVVQERSDKTHILAVAVDIDVIAPEGDRRLTTVLDVRTR